MKSTAYRLLVAILSVAMVFTLLPSTVFAAGKPTITQQPVSVTSGVGDMATFTVKADGAESYAWQVKKSSASSWGSTSFATSKTDTLVVTATTLRNGYQYRCKVTNASGSVYSQPATLTVVPLPSIYAYSEQDITAMEGTTVKMQIVADDADSYQWQYRKNSTDTWSNATASGNKTDTLSVPATASRNGYQYRCKVTNFAGSVYSSEFILTIDFRPRITVQPLKVNVNEGETATFTVASPNADSYQWQVKKNSESGWVNTSFATSKTDTLVVTAKAERNGYKYRCRLTNAAGTVYSNAAALNIVLKPYILTQPKSVTTDIGKTAVFSVNAVGVESYQWQYRTGSTGTWANATAPGNKTATLSVPATASRHGYQYRCKLTGQGRTRYSSSAKLTVKQAIVITTQPMSPMAEIGTRATVSVEATSNYPLKYQWQYRTGSTGTWANATASGNKTATLSIPATVSRNGYQYRCKISNDYTTKYSDTVRLDVYGITKHPQDVTVTENEEVTLSVTAIGDVIDYEWQRRSSSTASWSDVNCTEDTYTFTPSLSFNGYQYRCKVVHAFDGVTVYSNAATLTVEEDENLPTLTWVTYPRSTYLMVGEDIKITAEVRGGEAPYTFEWTHSYYIDGVSTEIVTKDISDDGISQYTKICEEKDIGSRVGIVIKDSSGQVLDYGIAVAANIGKYTPISKKEVSTADVVIDYDNLPSSSYDMRRMEVALDSWGSFALKYEWQYVPASVEKNKITEDDWQLMPGEAQSFGNGEPFLGVNTNTLYIKKCTALKTFLGTDGVWFRLKVTDTERNVTLIAREGKMYLK